MRRLASRSSHSMGLASIRQRAAVRHGRWGVDRVREHVWLGSAAALSTVPSMSDTVRDAFFASYVDQYIVCDAAKLGSIEDLGRFRTFLQVCAALIGQQVNYAQLADMTGISLPTAKRWLYPLVGMNIICLLPAFSHKAVKKRAKTPQIYFSDTGVAAWLTRWPAPDTLWAGALGNAFFENAVVSELIAALNAGPDSYSVSYLRDSNKTEIDVIIEKNGTFHPIEIKQGSMPRHQEVRKFEMIDRAGLQRGAGGIICSVPEPVAIDNLNSYIPAWVL